MNVLNLGSPREPWVGCDSPLCVAILSDCNATVLELNAIDAIWSVLSRTGLPGNWKLPTCSLLVSSAADLPL